MPGPGSDEWFRPFFRPRAKVIGFAVTFLTVLAVQAGVVWTMHATASDAINDALGTELQTVATSAASAVSVPLERGAPDAELGAMLRRVRSAHHLEDIVIVDRLGRMLADHRGTPAGTPASVFAATPSRVERIFFTRAPSDERFHLLGDPYRRVYVPIERDGTVWGVLCLSVYDRVPAGLQALAWPLEISIGASVVTALMLAAVAVAVMRFFDRTQRHLLNTARLTTAGALAASIAHDVCNPMAVVLSSTQLLYRASNLDADQRELLTIMEDEVRHADEQLDAFLDLTRDMPLKRRREDLMALVGSTLDLFRARARSTDIDMELVGPSTPIFVDVDRRKLRQALANLLLNAAEAVENHRHHTDGRITIGVTGPPPPPLRSSPPESELQPSCVEIEITDNGPGIPADRLDRVVEPFFTTKPGGTGVGLSSARQVAQRHGGALTVKSVLGQGTTVRLTLPAAAGVEMTDETTDANPHR